MAITVSSNVSNVTVNTTSSVVTVTSTPSNIILSPTSVTSNATIRQAISVSNISGYGNLTYDSSNTSNGVIQYVGVSTADIRQQISNTAPILYNSTTGVIDIDSNAVFSGKTTDDLIEGTTNLYLNGAGTTDDLTEGTNLYWTTDRGNAATVAYFGDSGNAPFTIAGNLDIAGNLNYENVTDLYVTDQKIVLNANAASDATVDIIAYRPVAGSNALLTWNETSDVWQFNDGSSTYTMPRTTDDLTEGTNLYFTNARANAAFTDSLDNITSNIISTANIQGSWFVGNVDASNVITYGLNVENDRITLNYNNATPRDAFIVVERNLSNIANASYDNVSFTLGPFFYDPRGVSFDNTGLKMYVSHDATPPGPTVAQYNLTTAYDISTASYSKGIGLSAQTTICEDAIFNDDGTKMYVAGNGSIYQYDLTTAYDVSTASYSNISLNRGTAGITFNNDGTRIYSAEWPLTISNSGIVQHDLSIPYDLSTATINGNVNTTAQDVKPADLFFNTFGTIMYVLGSQTKKIYQYSLSTPFDVTTASYTNNNFSVNSQEINPRGLARNARGDKFYIVGLQTYSIYQYTLSTDPYIEWNESVDRWLFSHDIQGNIVGQVSDLSNHNTDDLAEGNTNLYYTTDRVNTAIQANITGSYGITFNTDNSIETTNADIRALFSGSGNINYDANTGVISESLTTTDITEGTNLYYTNARANAAFVDSLDNISVPIVSTANITTTANVQGNWFVGNVDATTANITTINGTTATFTGNVDANYFSGDGGGLSNVSASANLALNTTDELAEGNVNLYYTNARVNAFIQDSITTDDITEGSTNLYFTNARANAAFTDSLDNIATDIISSANITTTANVQGSYFIGNVSGTTADFTGNITAGNIVSDSVIDTTANITTTGNITGGYIIAGNDTGGDGFFIGDLNGAILVEVYNASGNTLNKGDIVALNGAAHGDTPDVVLADSGNASLMPGFGVVKENIADTAVGEAVISGKMNYTAHGFTIGAQLYVDGTGTFTETRPTGEDQLVQKIATVTNANTLNIAGAGRTNDIYNVDEGKIILGSTSNVGITVTPDSNFDTTGNAFSLSNTLTDVNSISSESNTALSLKGLKINIQSNVNGGLSTFENVVNISTTGYSVNSASPDTEHTNSIANNATYAHIVGAGSPFGTSAAYSITEGSNVITINPGAYVLRGDTFGFDSSDINVIQLYENTFVNGAKSTFWEFAPSAYVTAVNSSGAFGGGNIIMSEPARANTFGTYFIIYRGGVDTVTGQNFSYPTNGSAGIDIYTQEYAYPESGWSNTDFTYSVAQSNASFTGGFTSQSVRQIADFESGNGVVRFNRASMIGSGGYPASGGEKNDTSPAIFGINVINDGLTDLSDTASRQPLQQIMLQQFSNNSAYTSTQSGLTQQQKDSSGPRIKFSYRHGDIDSNFLDKYVRANVHIGKIVASGGSQNDQITSEYVFPASITFRAEEDWTDNRNAGVYFQNTPKESPQPITGPRTWLAGVNGNVTVQTSQNGEFIVSPFDDFSNATVGAYEHSLNAGHKFISVGYGNASAKTGSILTVQRASGNTNGSYSTVGDSVLRLQAHNANGTVKTYWDIIGEEATDNLIISHNSVEIAEVGDTQTQFYNTVKLKQFAETVVDLGNISGDISGNIDVASGSIFKGTLTGNITLDSITNAVAGTSATLILTQSTGAELLSSTMLYAGGIKTLSTSASAVDVISLFYDGSTYYASLTTGYA